MARSTRIQGVLVVVHGIGVLIRGPAGLGKSLAAVNLVRRGHRLVADDLVEIVLGPEGEVIGTAVEEAMRIEIRGLGVFKARSLFPEAISPSARVDLVVDLDEYDPAKDAGRLEPDTSETLLLGKTLLTVRIPVATGMEPATLIELLARLYKEHGSVNPS
ncbi:MAG: hypothetical protein HY914_06350 [Desulfomonile tiedjei]|nr:hypothetical protein [Desulfomonile tiedjei]